MEPTSQEKRGDPRAEYVSRLADRRAARARWERRHIVYGNWRLAVFASALALVWFCLIKSLLSPLWLLAPVVLFICLAVLHERVLRTRERCERAADFYQRGLDRLDDRWAGHGEKGDRYQDPAHPYAADLDLFGEGSLFELLCTTRLRSGEEALARWLKTPAPPLEVRARQEAVLELRDQVDLREDLALLGEALHSAINPEALATWSAGRALLYSRAQRRTAAVLSALAAAGAAVWFFADIAAPFLVVAAVEAVFALRLRRQVLRVIQNVGTPAYGLTLVEQVLACLENHPFHSPRLLQLQKVVRVEGDPPSRRIHRLNRLVEMLDSRDNVVLRVIGPPLLYTTQLAFAIEAWRARCGSSVRTWLAAAGEFEALCSLAGYAYEHPADPFPELVEGPTVYRAENLGHPLLPESRSVRNDVCLDGDVRVLVLSGSNMSGKSTLLRTVGTNAVLALAGAPVRARRLELSPLVVGASIRTLDSLQSGTSRFYAEIQRLRQLLDMARGETRLLFLLDELLHGTNSHDRAQGAEAYVLSLVRHDAIGLLTTHDMALAHIAESPQVHGANAHFEDHIENGKMRFDYRLRPGILTKSNAIELMRSVGLEI